MGTREQHAGGSREQGRLVGDTIGNQPPQGAAARHAAGEHHLVNAQRAGLYPGGYG